MEKTSTPKTLGTIAPLTWLLFFLVSSVGILQAQHNHQGLGCGTEHMVQKALRENPELRKNLEENERLWQEAQRGKADTFQTEYIIPTVVHIIHFNGGENISKAQVLDAMRIMNEDLNLQNRDTSNVSHPFKPLRGNARFTFRLATKDPNGNCSEGITRTVSELTFAADDNVKDLIHWPTDKYFNIWVVASISFNAGGYAYYPGTAPRPNYEGVVVLNRQFGSIGLSTGGNFSARTLTHEVGHYLNLPHTWGNSNTPGSPNNCFIDDGVDDTPLTVGVSGQGCPLSAASCGSLDNVENYMDYSNCGRMFTIGQCARMRVAARSSRGARNNLWTLQNLIATGTVDGFQPNCPPIGIVQPYIEFACAGSPITMRSFVYNIQEDTTLRYRWYFPEGVPNFSTERVPSVVFSSIGPKEVTLVVENNEGKDSIVYPNYVFIRPGGIGINAPFNESFESPNWPEFSSSVPDLNYSVTSNRSGFTFRRTNLASASGDFSAFVQASNDSGATTSILTPIIDLSGISTALRCSFKYAFIQQNTADNSIFRVQASTDCGQTWRNLISRSRASIPRLNTVGVGQTQTGPFLPNASEWRTESVSLDSYRNAGRVQLRFEFIADEGNNFFLDDINISPLGSLVALESNKDYFEVYPNPASGSSILRISPDIPKGNYQVIATDAIGRTISTGNLLVAEGLTEFQIQDILKGFAYQGLVNIQLSNPQFRTRKPVVFINRQ